MDNTMTFEEVAKKMGVTRQTIYNYIDKGFLSPIKTFNGRVKFDRAEVLRLLEPVDKIPFSEPAEE